MARDVKVRFHTFLPGAGFDASGNPKQGKTRVVGEVDVTSYARGGEALSAIDVGLNTIDSLTLRVGDETGDPSATRRRQAIYSKSVSQFYLVDTTTAGVPNERADAATETVEFVAEGDSAADPELL
jgi:hypothetical protein